MPVHEISVFIVQASSQESDEPAHSGSLTRALAALIHKVWNE